MALIDVVSDNAVLQRFLSAGNNPAKVSALNFFLRSVWAASLSPLSGGPLGKLCISNTIKSNLFIFAN